MFHCTEVVLYEYHITAHSYVRSVVVSTGKPVYSLVPQYYCTMNGIDGPLRASCCAGRGAMQARFLSRKKLSREKKRSHELNDPPLVAVRVVPVSDTDSASSAGSVVTIKISSLREETEHGGELTADAIGAEVASRVIITALELVSPPWSDGFALVSEKGWVAMGEGRYCVARFRTQHDALAASAQLWHCWVLYREDETEYEEVARGGIGFAHAYVGKYVREKMQAVKMEARRVSNGGRPILPADVNLKLDTH